MKLALCTLFLLAAPAWARECSALNQAAMDTCYGQQFTHADTVLNATYKALMAKITAGSQTSLRAAEKSWLAYRDNQCAFETLGTAGGTIHPMMDTICRTELTQAQAARLQAQLDCKEGDTSCGGQ